jgi:hypothetical protein
MAELPWRFQLSALVNVGSGRPFNILAGADLNGDGDGGAFPADRARVIPSEPSSSVRRNIGTLAGMATVDLRITRRIPVKGRWVADVLIDVFNAFNRTNYTEINNVFGTGSYPGAPLPTFGQYEKAGPPRQAQIGARINF